MPSVLPCSPISCWEPKRTCGRRGTASAGCKGKERIYITLFLPSRVSWLQNNTRVKLTQNTQYPSANTSHFDFALDHPETFAVYLRIPSWIGPKTNVTVNGRKVESE